LFGSLVRSGVFFFFCVGVVVGFFLCFVGVGGVFLLGARDDWQAYVPLHEHPNILSIKPSPSFCFLGSKYKSPGGLIIVGLMFSVSPDCFSSLTTLHCSYLISDSISLLYPSAQ